MSTIRTIALIFIFGHLAAMLVEPFFEKLFDQIGWDTEDFAVPLVNFASNFASFVSGYDSLLYVIMGIGLGVWLHYFASRFESATPSKTSYRSVARQTQTELQKSNARSDAEYGVNDTHDLDLILRPQDTVVVDVTCSDDGMDIFARVVIRNRSKAPLWIDVAEQYPLIFNGKTSDNKSGGVSRPMPPESNNASVFGGLRLYETVKDGMGRGRISYRFGRTEDSAKWILDVDISFKILNAPKNKKVQERVSVEIVENNSVYRLIPDEE